MIHARYVSIMLVFALTAACTKTYTNDDLGIFLDQILNDTSYSKEQRDIFWTEVYNQSVWKIHGALEELDRTSSRLEAEQRTSNYCVEVHARFKKPLSEKEYIKYRLRGRYTVRGRLAKMHMRRSGKVIPEPEADVGAGLPDGSPSKPKESVGTAGGPPRPPEITPLPWCGGIDIADVYFEDASLSW